MELVCYGISLDNRGFMFVVGEVNPSDSIDPFVSMCAPAVLNISRDETGSTQLDMRDFFPELFDPEEKYPTITFSSSNIKIIKSNLSPQIVDLYKQWYDKRVELINLDAGEEFQGEWEDIPEEGTDQEC